MVGVLIACGGASALAGQGRTTDGLVIRYPNRHQRVVTDSNFILGTVGSGAVSLEIDGVAVDVAPDGAFLAWLEVPTATRADTAVYRFVLRSGEDTTVHEHPIRRPLAARPPGAPSPWVDPSGLGELPERWVRPGETLRLDFVAERGSALTLEAGEVRIPVPRVGLARGELDRYAVDVDPAELTAAACDARPCAPVDDPSYPETVRSEIVQLELASRLGTAVARWPVSAPLAVLSAADRPGARLREAEDPVAGEAGVVVGRPTAFGPYRWRLPEGAVVEVTGRLGDRLRVRLAGDLEAWVLAEDVEWTDRPREPARTWDARAARASAGALEPADVTPVFGEVVTFRIGVSRPVTTDVAVTGTRSLSLTLYDTHGGLDRIAHGVGTGVSSVRWTQLAGPIVRVDLELEWPIWGYRLSYEPGDAAAYEGPRGPDETTVRTGTVLRLDLRRPPPLDPTAPLAGLRIAIDPGHPGGGSTGPGGLFEGDANLAVARLLARKLEVAGADPFLTRTGSAAVGLYDRTRRARDGGAELFVSIHNNALPDGIRPFDRAGTTTYYHHRHALDLARAVQTGMVERLGLRDLGVVWGDLAVAREAWMPSILTEGAFMIIPEQEAALRTPAFQDAYAQGVFDGIERFLTEIAGIRGG